MVKKVKSTKADSRREIPAVDKILREPTIVELTHKFNRTLVKRAVQTVLETLRTSKQPKNEENIVTQVHSFLKQKTEPSLKR